MRKEIETIFTEEITLPEIVQKKANLAFEEIKNKECDTMKNNTSVKRTASKGNLFRKAPAWAAIIILALCVLVPTSVVLAKKGFSLYERMHRITTDEWLEICETYCNLPGHYTTHSRDFTEEELLRYNKLLLEYQTKNISPDYQIRIAENKADITNEEIFIWFDEERFISIIELPDAPLDNNHLLALIDYEQKQSYGYSWRIKVKNLGGITVWKRLETLTQEEIERYYLIYYGANLNTYGGYRGRYPSALEQKRYDELLAAYEAGIAYPQGEIAYIDAPEDFTGEYLAFCLSDEHYYLPETPLSDEDILQMIDLDKKAYYSILQLNEQYTMGEREHMPRRK